MACLFKFLMYLFCVPFSSYGQNLTTSTFIGETSFAILISILGLVLFAHLIGNMQVLLHRYLLHLTSSQGYISNPN